MLPGRPFEGWLIWNINYVRLCAYLDKPSVWVCPPVPDVLWASCSSGGSSRAAAEATAGEGRRWSRFQRGSASRDVPRTPSNPVNIQTGKKKGRRQYKSCQIMWPECNVKWEEGRKIKSAFYQHETQQLQINKAPWWHERGRRRRAIWTWKTFSLSGTQKSVSREDRMLGSFVRWKRDDIPWCICHAQICVACV